VKLIGLHGEAGAGKDFLGDLLVKHHGFVKMALADKMKRIVRESLGFSVEQLWGPSAMRNAPDKRFPREHGPWVGMHCVCCGVTGENPEPPQCYLTPRLALQLLGTEWGRICYANVWVDYAMRIALDLLEHRATYSKEKGIGPGTNIDERVARGVVITDVRFDNEASAIHKAGGNIYVVDRAGAGLRGAAGKHVSERGISKELIDGVIANAPGTPLETTLALLAEIAR
jgi:hypothetical protein